MHFFDRHYKKGLLWYRTFFPLKYVHGSRVTGEASPSYLFHPVVAKRIHENLPDVKLIAVLRNPVDRAYSHYQHTKRKGFEELSFAEALAEEAERTAGEEERMLEDPEYHSHAFYAYSYVARGLYARQLERYFELFDRGQVYVVQSEVMLSNPQQVVDEVSRFLDLEPRPIADVRVRNRGNYERKRTREHEMLYERFREPNEALFRLIGKHFDWDG
ncbi:sulfotransferase domain-containing protein [Rhodocaloribacter litoris]|uniref:sulfotransferase domain-containing protein n=1 Tax=Rhodocaloribacter litoris TaxID=2558931 RepID=UPI0014214D22|nr:sulfotransferase domain-containing protein [Rhodocaloribacter litoris]QXD16194.1 sulfotransferase domain-containing protein [Rhodocaloribacter litoris]